MPIRNHANNHHNGGEKGTFFHSYKVLKLNHLQKVYGGGIPLGNEFIQAIAERIGYSKIEIKICQNLRTLKRRHNVNLFWRPGSELISCSRVWTFALK